MSSPYMQQEAETILKGLFQCSLMLVSVQTQGPSIPDKLCLCRHLSKGNKHSVSTNSYVNKGKFPTKVGTASNVADIVSARLPPTLPTSPFFLLSRSAHRCTRNLVPYPTLLHGVSICPCLHLP
jgi:hypothetical protein